MPICEAGDPLRHTSSRLAAAAQMHHTDDTARQHYDHYLVYSILPRTSLPERMAGAESNACLQGPDRPQ